MKANFRLSCASLPFVMGLAPLASAEPVTITWVGGGSGNWNQPSNWSPQIVPDSGVDVHHAVVPSGAATMNGSFTLGSLDIAAGATVNLPPGHMLAILEGGTIDGLFVLGQDGNFNAARIRATGDVEWSGTGTTELEGTVVIDSPAGHTLTNSHTIRSVGGSTGFDLGVINHGHLGFEGTGHHSFNHPDGQMVNTGTLKAEDGAILAITAISNPIGFANSGVVDLDGGHLEMNWASLTNTHIVRVRNGGSLRLVDHMDNTGGVLILETGGRLIPSAPFGHLAITGGAIEGDGGVVDQTDFWAQNELRLVAPPGEPMAVAGTTFRVGRGRVLGFDGEFELDGSHVVLENEFGFPSGGRLSVTGEVEMTGSGSVQLGDGEIPGGFEILGTTGTSSLTCGPGIELRTGSKAGAGSIAVATMNVEGPLEIDSPNFQVASGSTLNASGPVLLAPEAILTSNGLTTFSGNSVGIGAGASIAGHVALDGATVSGEGGIDILSLGLSGQNSIASNILAGQAEVRVSGAAELDGNGIFLIQKGFSGTVTFNPDSPGATLATGAGLDIQVAPFHGLRSNVSWRLLGGLTLTDSTFMVDGDLRNDGVVELLGTSQMTLGADVSRDSSGTFHFGPLTTVTVDGAAELGGSWVVSGAFDVVGPTAVTIQNFGGSGPVAVAATSQMSITEQSFHSGDWEIRGKVYFDGGLPALREALVTGPAAVLWIEGDAATDGPLRVRQQARLAGDGVTTVNGPLEFNGILDGRTLVLNGETTCLGMTMENGAGCINNGEFALHTFGPAASILGPGSFINHAVLTQQPSPLPNRIGCRFEQSETGVLNIFDHLRIDGLPGAIAGEIGIAGNGVLVLACPPGESTQQVTARVAGSGVVEVTDGTSVVLANLELEGPGSGLQVSDGASAAVHVKDGTKVGETFEVEDADVDLQQFADSLAMGAWGVDNGRVHSSGDERMVVDAGSIDLSAPQGNSCEFGNLELRTRGTCRIHGRVDLLDNSAIAIGEGGILELGNLAEIIKGELELQGGDFVIQSYVEGAVAVEMRANNSDVTVQAGAVLNVNGRAVSSTVNNEVFPSGRLAYDGPLVANGSQFEAHPGSGGVPGGTIELNEVQELTDCTLRAGADAEIRIVLAPDADRSDFSDAEGYLTGGSISLKNVLGIDPVTFSGFGHLDLESLGPLSATLTLSPGSSPGRVHVTGGFAPGAGSKFVMEIGGPVPETDHDVIHVQGVLDIGGTALQLEWLDGFEATVSADDEFVILGSSQPIVGMFSNVTGGRVMTADGLGNFAVTLGAGGTSLLLDDYTPGPLEEEVDSDGDGMPDAFEEQYFGSAAGGDPHGDADGDGQTNLAEFLAGTDPTDPMSVFRITEIRREGDDVVVVFQAMPGKAYRVESAPALGGSFPLVVAQVPATAEGGIRTVNHTGGGAAEKAFYRAAVVP